MKLGILLPNLCVIGFLAASLPVLAGPAEDSPTLRKIANTGLITLGHRESSIPFSYYDERQQVIGYSHDLMLKVVEGIRNELRLSRIDIRLMPVTSANRITLVQNGTIDIECGSTTNNVERQKQVSFSTTIFIVGTRLLTRANSGINDFSDLVGKNLVTTAGTTSERLIRRLNDEKSMGMNIISTKDHGEAFLNLESGRAIAFMMDDALLYGEMVKARKMNDWVVTGTPLSKEAYGCMLRKDDPGFKKVVDAALSKSMLSGEAERIYLKWFTAPIPPKGLNLNMPLSDEMKALYKAPNDRALD